jgi:hypothetical protein
MKQFLVASLLAASMFSLTVAGQQRHPASKRSSRTASNCAPNIQNTTHCPDEGCGGQYDPNLNRRKNIRSDNQQAIMRSIQWMKALPDPKHFSRQNTNRGELSRLGEGQRVTVAAYALVARKGSKESCNCGLAAPKDTDNHIVLVDPALKNPTLEANEEDSETAEFTPRVRLQHRNFTREKLEPLIEAHGGKLLVRITGLLMFDSEHFLGRHLKRHNNWEVHPVLKLEYCSQGATCRPDSNANWKNLDRQ